MDMFTGRWTANLSESKRHPDHLFKSASMSFAVSGEVVTLTHEGINAEGNDESGAITLQVDGVERPLSDATDGLSVVSNWLSPHKLEMKSMKDGAVIGRGTYEVSGDGRKLVATVEGVDASGKRFEQTIVSHRD